MKNINNTFKELIEKLKPPYRINEDANSILSIFFTLFIILFIITLAVPLWEKNSDVSDESIDISELHKIKKSYIEKTLNCLDTLDRYWAYDTIFRNINRNDFAYQTLTNCIGTRQKKFKYLGSNNLLYNIDSINIIVEVDSAKLIAFSKYPVVERTGLIKYGGYIKVLPTRNYELKVEETITIAGIFIFFFIIFQFLFKSTEPEHIKPKYDKVKVNEISENNNISSEKSEIGQDYKTKTGPLLKINSNKNWTVKDVLHTEMDKLNEISNEVNRRASLLLILSLIVALIGIVFFYFSLPNFQEPIDQNYIKQSIKPSLILIFIQSISWYLLRQYRVSVEDFKYFQKRQEKRANFLSAYIVLSQEKVLDYELVFSMLILGDDLTGKLKQNETTELIENSKLIDKNPMTEIIQSLINKITNK